MYQQHFGMHTDPFPLTPKLAFVFPSRAFGETMAHLVYGIEQAEDIILITGGIGTGKTLAVNSLLAQVQRVLDPVLVNVTRLTFPELLKYVLLELGETVPGAADTPDLLQHLKRVLHQRREQGRKVLLIVDEAQHLGADTLESLRLLMNLSTPEAQCLQLVLVGQHALEETIGRRELAQLNQRIRVRYRIEPLSRQEVEAYLDHRVRVAGCSRHLFRPGAIDRIYALSHGIPRVVNILASRALLAAFVASKAMVEPSHVRVDDLPPVTDAVPVEPGPEPKEEPASVAPPEKASVVPPLPRTAAAEPTPAAESEPYLMWPPNNAARGAHRRRGLMIALPIVVALAAVLAWQWPNLNSSPPTRAVRSTVSSPVDRPAVQASVPPSPQTSEVAEPVDDRETVPAPDDGRQPPASTAERRLPAADTVRPDVREPVAPVTSTPVRTGDLAVHVGSFHDSARADRLVQRLTGAGYSAYTTQDVVDGEPWVRVYAGPFPTSTAAEQARARLTEGGVVAYARVITVGL